MFVLLKTTWPFLLKHHTDSMYVYTYFLINLDKYVAGNLI